MKTTAARIALALTIAITTLTCTTACDSPCPGQEVVIKQVPAKWNGFSDKHKVCKNNSYYGTPEHIESLRVDK